MTASLILLAVFTLVALVTLSAILRGWVLSILWGWFAVPILGLPPLGVVQAIGIAMIVGLLTHQYAPSQKETKDPWAPLGFLLIGPFLTLGVGWIVKGFLP